MIDYAPFDGDGRSVTMTAPPDAPGHPIAIRVGVARMLIRNLLNSKQSNHSSRGNVLWVLVLWCQTHNKRYTLETHYSGTEVWGYRVVLHD